MRNCYFLLLSLVLSVCCWVNCGVARATSAEKMPRKGYKMKYRPGRVEALIGRRSSEGMGEKAALRMLSRLLYRYDGEGFYKVHYSILDAKGQGKFFELYWVDRESALRLALKYGPEIYDYAGVQSWMIQRAAKDKRGLAGVMRYGAVEILHDLQAFVGTHFTLALGNRAAVQAMARLVKKPGNHRCLVRWHYASKERKFVIEAEYDPLYHTLRNELKPASKKIMPYMEYNKVNDTMLLHLARKRQTWGDLMQSGANE